MTTRSARNPHPPVSALWKAPRRSLPHHAATLTGALHHAASEYMQRSGRPAKVFFRADDVAMDSAMNTAMFEAFIKAGVPLAPALVPAWLNADRWHALLRLTAAAPHLWAWHQHGWRHRNGQQEGKKGEFGSDRHAENKTDDILKGRDKLRRVTGNACCPLFTPPWNRMDGEALTALAAAGFRAVSRSAGAMPPAPPQLTELPVNVDLHTRREAAPHEGWQALTREICAAVSTGWCGIMLHHNRMNGAAAAFLTTLLVFIRDHPHLHVVDVRRYML
ncbi:DUF2334 domain-containing protein [Oleidesulfovibrio alaskensis]|jgi:hypothetical protein|uniref:DUF2334 domain-containing protein n=1 Tax=Oleidesulfovibrio alaskensis TaxID=58180 RepID=UPI001A5DE327|nr:polysaccharide deacetylase family protein [Oleidesulfovibrio alaskensis]MBL3581379.1 polysaccharide deacetylase family protein [Oleidesulfovibrio alaskensis]